MQCVTMCVLNLTDGGSAGVELRVHSPEEREREQGGTERHIHLAQGEV